jgi:hypothetical protein
MPPHNVIGLGKEAGTAGIFDESYFQYKRPENIIILNIENTSHPHLTLSSVPPVCDVSVHTQLHPHGGQRVNIISHWHK